MTSMSGISTTIAIADEDDVDRALEDVLAALERRRLDVDEGEAVDGTEVDPRTRDIREP